MAPVMENPMQISPISGTKNSQFSPTVAPKNGKDTKILAGTETQAQVSQKRLTSFISEQLKIKSGFTAKIEDSLKHLQEDEKFVGRVNEILKGRQLKTKDYFGEGFERDFECSGVELNLVILDDGQLVQQQFWSTKVLDVELEAKHKQFASEFIDQLGEAGLTTEIPDNLKHCALERIEKTIIDISKASEKISFLIIYSTADQKDDISQIIEKSMAFLDIQIRQIVLEDFAKTEVVKAALSYTLGSVVKTGGFVFVQFKDPDQKNILIAQSFLKAVKVFFEEAHRLPVRIIIHRSGLNDDEELDRAYRYQFPSFYLISKRKLLNRLLSYIKTSFLAAIAKALRDENDLRVYNSRMNYCPELFLLWSPRNADLFPTNNDHEKLRSGTFGSAREFFPGAAHGSFFITTEMKDGEEVTPDFFLVRKHRGMVTEDEERRIGMLAFLLSFDQTTARPSSGLNVARAARKLSRISGETLFSVVNDVSSAKDWMLNDWLFRRMSQKRRPFWL
ncbi:unnamed protein product [Caenorhabditis auriculariae]|uniref:Uncharacterized protein n=1 Tax=Caenorhabditis auriculariae TaxID=2777116 RepID=A0A8S1HJ04_9PELO|nr:unnamed protein product [Caenorhabditis auriculariae]